MPMPVSNEIRNKIIIHKQNKVTEDDITDWRLISKSKVTKIWSRDQNTGSFMPSARRQGRKSAVHEETMNKVEEKIKEAPEMKVQLI